MTGNKLGLPFCGSGSPVHGCGTIGLAHSRNLLMALSRPQSSNSHLPAWPLAALIKKPHPAGNPVQPACMLRGPEQNKNSSTSRVWHHLRAPLEGS